MSTYYTILTNIGLAKMINAQAAGAIVQWSAMAVGDGNGNPTNPTQVQTALLREKYRAPLNQLSVDPTNPNYLIAEMIIPATQGGWTVHEVGLFDADGDMVAVANFPMTYKPLLADGSTRDLVIRIIVEVSNAATVQLKIDPAVVLASRQWVATNYIEKSALKGGTTNQVLRKKSNADLDTEWADPLSAVQVIVVSREETQTLASNQVIVDLAQITSDGCAVYIEGARLFKSEFALNTSTRITLGRSYPAGTRVTIVQNEETGDYPQATEVQGGIAEVATDAETKTGTDDARMVTPLKLARRMRLSSPVVGTARNLKMSVTAASASATVTADEILVKSAIGSDAWMLGGFNKTINLAGTGAGGMDTGTAPVNGYVAVYAIYNPTSGASALLAANATSAVAPEVYGGANMPAGYTASALVSVWATNASSQFKIGLQRDRRVSIAEASALSSSTNMQNPTALSLASIIPMNAKSVSGSIGARTTSVPSNMELEIGADSTFVGRKRFYGVLTSANQTSSFAFETQINAAQTIYYAAQAPVGTPTHTMFISEYTF